MLARAKAGQDCTGCKQHYKEPIDAPPGVVGMPGTACAVVRVRRENNTDLIKSCPALTHGLLADMANSIVTPKEQLVGLRGN